MQITPSDIDSICGLIHDLCGVYLDASKSYLIESRLGEIVRKSGCANYAEFARKARYTSDRMLQNQVIDAITTHETLFFRDSAPFDALKNKVIPDLIDRKVNSSYPRRLRIWSAACSTGQEPYSIAIALAELLFDWQKWDIKITATDISDDAVKKASRGWFAQHEIERGMSTSRLQSYFRQEDQGWRIKEELRSLITFQKFNLLESFKGMGPFDIIFCRNVAIYFTPPARKDLFQRLTQVLNQDGYLFVGSQESLIDLGPRFHPQTHCRAMFYRPNLANPNLAANGKPLVPVTQK